MTEPEDDEELQALRESTQVTDRARAVSEHPDETAALVEDFITVLEAVENGDRPKVINARDPNFAALLHTLADNPDHLREVGTRLQDALDEEVMADEVTRSALVLLSLKYTFREFAPEYLEMLQDALAERARQSI